MTTPRAKSAMVFGAEVDWKAGGSIVLVLSAESEAEAMALAERMTAEEERASLRILDRDDPRID